MKRLEARSLRSFRYRPNRALRLLRSRKRVNKIWCRIDCLYFKAKRAWRTNRERGRGREWLLLRFFGKKERLPNVPGPTAERALRNGPSDYLSAIRNQAKLGERSD